MPKKLAGGPAPDLEDAFDVSFCCKGCFVTCFFTLFLGDHVLMDCINAGFFFPSQLDDDVEEEVESKEEEEDNDVSKDSLIKMAKGKGKGKAGAGASASGKSARKKQKFWYIMSLFQDIYNLYPTCILVWIWKCIVVIN